MLGCRRNANGPPHAIMEPSEAVMASGVAWMAPSWEVTPCHSPLRPPPKKAPQLALPVAHVNAIRSRQGSCSSRQRSRTPSVLVAIATHSSSFPLILPGVAAMCRSRSKINATINS